MRLVYFLIFCDRAELQRQIAEIDAKEEKLAPPRPPKPKPAKPVSKVKRTKPALPSFSEIIAKDEVITWTIYVLEVVTETC